MNRLKVGVVIPSNRPNELEKWAEAWAPYLESDDDIEYVLYKVLDNQDTWNEIKGDLGTNSWIIPIRTDCIRSYGFLKAWRDGCDVTITLDDDVRPTTNTLLEHLSFLQDRVEPDSWVRTMKGRHQPPTRGLPLSRPVVLSHGLWDGVPDVSAKTQLEGYRTDYILSDPDNNQIIPEGKFYPMSGMNLAFLTRVTPFMYFTLQGYDIRDNSTPWGLHRCGDILAGVLSKTVFDRHGWAVHSGEPYVYHERASDPNVNLELEKNTYDLPALVAYRINGIGSYLGVAESLFHFHVNGIRKDYFHNLALAMRIWYGLFKDAPAGNTRARGVAPSRLVSESQDATPSNPGLAESEGIS